MSPFESFDSYKVTEPMRRDRKKSQEIKHKRQREARSLYNQVIFSQDIYCGGYSGEDPPLPIPNREVKLTIADGTAPPGGRVGSCHESYETLISHDVRVFSYILMIK